MLATFYNFLRAWMLPLDEIDRLVPKSGKVFDLGCGQGVIAKYLARVKSRNVVGVDNNEKRLPKSERPNLKFVHSDLTKYELRSSGTVIISDVLHHLKPEDQKKLLTKISKILKKRDILLIKEVDTGEFIRSRLTRLWDFILYPGDRIYFHNANVLKSYLASLSFKVDIKRPSRLFPGSTTLFICQKN